MKYQYILTKRTDLDDNENGYVGEFYALSPYLKPKAILENIRKEKEIYIFTDTIYLVDITAENVHSYYYFETDATGNKCYLLIRSCAEDLQ